MRILYVFALQRYEFFGKYGNFWLFFAFFLPKIWQIEKKFVLLQPDECHTACSF